MELIYKILEYWIFEFITPQQKNQMLIPFQCLQVIEFM